MPKVKNRPKKKPAVCALCRTNIDDEMCFGKFYVKKEIAVHNFCLLFASGLGQNGKTDNDGIAGFLIKDIKQEIIRGSRLRCSFCKTTGATIGCCKPACKKVFHFSCGLKKNTLHQFFGGFMSYCQDHKPRRILPSDFSSLPNELSCAICYSPVYPKNSETSLWTSCCKNGWFHKTCIQKQAMSAGYFFRCPLCNNNEAFQKQMEYHGIYIPQQDASWELEENAYQDLLFRHWQCDAAICTCPKGRKFHRKSSPWCLVRCVDCGSQGRHVLCENLAPRQRWNCEQCKKVTERLKKKGNEKFKPCSRSQTAPLELPYSGNLPNIEKSSTSLLPKGDIQSASCCKCENLVIPLKLEKKPCISRDNINSCSLAKPLAKTGSVECKKGNISPSLVEVGSVTCGEIKIESSSQGIRNASLSLETNNFSAELVSHPQSSKILLLGEGSSLNRTLGDSDLTCVEENKVLNSPSSQHFIENLPPIRERPIQQVIVETNMENKHKLCTLKKKDSMVIIGVPPAALSIESSSVNSFSLATSRSSDSANRATSSAAASDKLRKRVVLEEEQNKNIKKQKLNNSSKRSRSNVNSKLNMKNYLCIKALFGRPCGCCVDKKNAIPMNLPVNSQHTKCSRNGCAGKFAIEVVKCATICQNLHQTPGLLPASDSTQVYALGLMKSSCEHGADNAPAKSESTPQKKYSMNHSSPQYKIDVIRSVPSSSTSEGNNEKLCKKPEIIHLRNLYA